MSEQGSQSSNYPQQLDSNTPDHDETGPYEPGSRADVDPRPLATVSIQSKGWNSEVGAVEDYATGFPRISCFLDSDDAFMVYRRFGSLYSRLLLSKQDEMSKLEGRLHAMDQMDQAENNGHYLMSRTLDVEREQIPEAWEGQSRIQLLERLEKLALQYAELLLKAQQLKAMDRPSNRDYRSVLSFMENDGGQLFEEDMEFIYEKEDLVTLRPGREYAWLDGLLERTLKVLRFFLLSQSQYLFPTHSLVPALRFLTVPRKETRDKTDDKDIHYYDRDRISTCVTMIITTIVLALLMVPIWLLYRLSVKGTIATSHDTIGVVLVFTLVFSAALSAFTKARRHEIVAASAG
ncbi:MAG: hypothetical protein ASARMPRED_000322 [Alectoria sarmentosa]|nr:MAG: hypothetical protein ASARMPRED_000322 [Alectoria sarmentosa]